MKHEELIAKARMLAERWEHAPKVCVKIETLPKIRVEEAVVVYFESDEHKGSIKVVLDKETGDLITASLIPPESTETIAETLGE